MKSKPVRALTYDPQKEKVFKELSGILESSGYQVRREKLKRGPGWRVVSGLCRADSNRYIFVDRAMSQKDQISFLVNRLNDLKVAIPDETRGTLCSVLEAPAAS